MGYFGYESGITPDYRHILSAARNVPAARMPIYEHNINLPFMDKMAKNPISPLFSGDAADLDEGMRLYCQFFRDMGYDYVSFECCAGGVMPGSGSLGGHKLGEIRDRADFERYPWADVSRLYFERFAPQFEAFARALPPGMKGIGGVGNGIFECVQEITGYMDLCYISKDDPELYADLYCAVADMLYDIWAQFLPRYGDLYCVYRMGDDMGYRDATLMPETHYRELLIPGLKRIVTLAKSGGTPFLLHSCGCIFGIMDDLIAAGIDAKHSNEDQIALFSEWMTRYGNRIALFGGIDLNTLCLCTDAEIREQVRKVIAKAKAAGCGFALGSGNSIPEYVPVDGYLSMIDEANKARR